MQQPTFKDARQAFNEAIEAQRLSMFPEDPRYAGLYMYMGTYQGYDMFKHKETRQYIP